MRSWIDRFRSAGQALMAALLLTLASAAWAGEEVRGAGVLEVKDVGAMTLQVDDAVIQVDDDTNIFNGDMQRISFAQIPSPPPSIMEVSYEGRLTAGKITATRLIVRLQPL